MSPEIGAGAKKYDFNADIWSLGSKKKKIIINYLVVLYELITLKKPWYSPELSTKQFFEMVLTRGYGRIPEDVPQELQYLVEIMLKRDPDRRANIRDILRLDFIYNRAKQMIKENGWEGVKDFEFDDEIENNVTPFYLNFVVMKEEDEELLYVINKLTRKTSRSEYKASYFGGTSKYAFNGDDLLIAFGEKRMGETTDDYQKDIFKRGLEKKVLTSLSHRLGNDISKFVDDLFEDPQSYYLESSTFNFDPYNRKCDNNYLIETESPITEDTNFLLYSQYILDCGIKALDAKRDTSINFIYDRNYIKFMAGVAYFQLCDPFKIPYDGDKHKDRLAFFYNLYQIFGIHCYINYLLDYKKEKSSLYGYFQNDVRLTYKFKNFSLNHLDVLHIVFRGNKPVPGSYMRLVYNSDIKCTLIPNFNSPAPLFLAYKVNDFFYTIFNSKEVELQLEERILRLIPEMMSYKDKQLLIDGEFKPYLKDFGDTCTEENPDAFLYYIIDLYTESRKYYDEGFLYKTPIPDWMWTEITYLKPELVSSIEKGEVELKYVKSKENPTDCFPIY